jgi:transketolase
MIRSFRAALCETLINYADKYPELVVLNADSARALKLIVFQKKFPNRMFCFGISEADMISQAAGMSTTGLIPVVVGFSMFVTEKPLEQIRQSIAYPNLNVKIVATHAGLCVGKDGASHQILEDLTIMRALPNFKILIAADVEEAKSAVGEMMLYRGPVYLRLGRDMAENIYQEHKKVSIGGSDLLREGSDVTLAACGLMVNKALLAAKILEEKNINASVMNIYSIKPLDKQAILAEARKTSAVVSIEDHSVIGGLGGALAELFAGNYPVPMEFIGVNDDFGESGNPDELYEKFGLSPASIAAAAERVINRKRTRRPNDR